ncbi:MAG: hypothetical protein UY67_C0024G0025 [Candidatus Kaiserbacteria bacterium GW2011_GWA2_52_12]|uniref:Uncharacterized protein n=1 Tax=Candidatus Kaiserbacteria bacterium GW2011_GWA2_52_12 TaxID=1618671 RepID=A0A0G1WX84_9BACT|nr:MAG: hypothetical protein UY67_C0024G0025 [Candidatus Kaiserbacteria bacterium GW2011_GWA2_52_12]
MTTYLLFLHVGEQAHEAGAFDRRVYRALLLGGKAALCARDDASVRIDELLQEIDIFVIDVLNIILCEDVGHTLKQKH